MFRESLLALLIITTAGNIGFAATPERLAAATDKVTCPFCLQNIQPEDPVIVCTQQVDLLTKQTVPHPHHIACFQEWYVRDTKTNIKCLSCTMPFTEKQLLLFRATLLQINRIVLEKLGPPSQLVIPSLCFAAAAMWDAPETEALTTEDEAAGVMNTLMSTIITRNCQQM